MVFLLTPSISSAELSKEQIKEKFEGIVLFNQYKTSTSKLLPAAEAGDAEAQYYLAEEIRSQKQYLSSDAVKWYEASARQGNIYAMIRLGRAGTDLCVEMKNCQQSDTSPKDWIEKAKKITLPNAEQGNGEALYFMYELTGDLNWLESSAKNGYAISQYLLATLQKQGEGSFWLPGQRDRSVEHWMKASAEGGYPIGMVAYGGILARKGDIEGYKKWRIKSAEAGYADSVLAYATGSAHEPDDYGYPLDLVKAYGLTLLLAELDGGGGMQADIKDLIPRIESKMTESDMKKGKKFADQWRSTHPPLSFFPDQLDE